MIVSSTGVNNYQNVGAITTSAAGNTAPVSTSSSGNVSSASTNVNASGINDSNLSVAVKQALAQINSGKDLTAYLSTDSSQTSAADFTSNLFSSLPGLSSSSNGVPVQLDQSSSSFKLQDSIQKLITQLDKASGTEGTSSGAISLQKSFNSLISQSGGNPAQQDLQSFLKLVAANVQGSSSIGSLFSASA